MTENHFQSHFSPFQINTQLFFFTKWLPAAILDDQKSLSNAFLAISDTQNGCRRPFWMTKNHFRMHFSPFQIRNSFFFEFIFSKWPPAAMLEVRFGPFWMTENHFRSHFSPFQINTQLFFSKWPPAGHFGSPICAKNNRVLPLCVINGYAN